MLAILGAKSVNLLIIVTNFFPFGFICGSLKIKFLNLNITEIENEAINFSRNLNLNNIEEHSAADDVELTSSMAAKDSKETTENGKINKAE